MYFEYLLTALAVILITSFAVYLVLKRKNRIDQANMINLVICTVLAMICTTLAPLLANFMVRVLYFSVFMSLLLSFFLFVVLAGVSFPHLQRVLTNLENKSSSESTEAPSENADFESVLQQTNEMSGLDSAALINETAISHHVDEAVSDMHMDEFGNSVLAEESVVVKQDEDLVITALEGEFAINSQANEFAISLQAEEAAAAVHTDTAVVLEQAAEPAVDSQAEAPQISQLLDQAMENKKDRRYPEAISSYEAAVSMQPDSELLAWVIVDLCALYKMTNQKERARKTLESLPQHLLDNEIKEDILQNL